MQVETSKQNSATVADDLLKIKVCIPERAQGPRESKKLEESTPYSGVLSMDPTYQEFTDLAKSPTKVQTWRRGTNPPHSSVLSPLGNKSLHLRREGQTSALVKTHHSSRKGARQTVPHRSGESWGQEYVLGPEL